MQTLKQRKYSQVDSSTSGLNLNDNLEFKLSPMRQSIREWKYVFHIKDVSYSDQKSDLQWLRVTLYSQLVLSDHPSVLWPSS